IATCREAIEGRDEQVLHVAPPAVEGEGPRRSSRARSAASRARAGAGPTPIPGPDGPEPRAPGDIPFVGRDRELATLRAALDRARLRAGRPGLVSGEAGLGKSRLLSEFRPRADAGGALCLEGRCVFQGGRTFEPWLGALEEFARRFGAAGGIRAEARRSHLTL